ncbi:MAG: DUF4363 family protein [Clostridia bacterium]|nr:DUF4363 family protein [Clostridia bacterium]
MKRLIAAAILIIGLTALCISGIFVVSNAYENFYRDIKECQTEIKNENYDAARTLSEASAKRWRQKRGILSIFINHGTVEQIDESITQLTSFANKENTAHFMAECEILKLNLLEMKEYCSVSLHTLF